MQLPLAIRTLARQALGTKGRSYVRRSLRRKLASFQWYRSLMAGRRGLEIGGPSELFSTEGVLPIYRSLKALDNCLYSSQTIWKSATDDGLFRHPALKNPGRQFICDATQLESIQDGEYECLLASHCLEHVANPLRALAEWKRVLGDGGLLLLALPHKEGTFDWRRPTTTLAHVMEDYDNNIGEEDLTHLEEVIELHDLSMDKAAGSRIQFEQRCGDNFRHRAMHHHVFETGSAVAMVDHGGFELLRVETFRPCHILITARRCEGFPNNAGFLKPDAAYRLTSCFSSDKPGGVLHAGPGSRLSR